MRKSGILLAVSSIPSKYGIGSFSKEAYEFVDFLKEAGQSLWQILPLGPTGYGDSPYQSFSTFAGNPYYIDLEEFITKGYLTKEECDESDLGDGAFVDYEKIFHTKFKLLKKAFLNSNIEDNRDYREFVKKNEDWLDDYALFMAIKDSFDGISWIEWDDDIKLRKKEALEKYRKELAQEIAFYKFQQYYFAKQWKELKGYANDKGIDIVGDIPIYVALDSADTWANPQLFQVDEECIPIAVAGCPPDAFSATGQLWGNPLYDWDYHKKQDYKWWVERIRYCYELYDIVRIDHFRGFDEYYSIPYGDPTAEFGHWEEGPGYELFQVIKKKLGKIKVIAEDLGFLTDSVIKLVKKTGYPGMKVLQFAFDSREESDYLPHNYVANSIVYTGTHDNDTTKHWYETLNRHDRQFAARYLDASNSKQICKKMIRAALSSVSETAVIPMQDYLELDGDARMNEPSTLGKNWKWRLVDGQCSDELAKEIYKMTKLYGRLVK